jgi:hypothetical protein
MGSWLVTHGVLHFVVSESPLCGFRGGRANGVACPECLKGLLEAVATGVEVSNPWAAA